MYINQKIEKQAETNVSYIEEHLNALEKYGARHDITKETYIVLSEGWKQIQKLDQERKKEIARARQELFPKNDIIANKLN